MQGANRICTIEPDGVFKDKGVDLDVQEVTESIKNKNANSQTGYASSCRRLQIIRVDDIPLGRFTILSAAWRGRIKSIGCQR